MKNKILVIVSLFAMSSLVVADDLTITAPTTFPPNAYVNKVIQATYQVKNDLGASMPINIQAAGNISNVSCNNVLPANGTCQFSVAITPTQTGSYQYGKHIKVCINHSPVCYQYNGDEVTVVTAEPTPPPAPTPSVWHADNEGLPNALYATKLTEFNGEIYALSVLGKNIIFKSHDGGMTWQTVLTRLPSNAQMTLTTAFSDSSNRLLLGTTHGLYQSTDGVTWTDVESLNTAAGETVSVDQIIKAQNALFVTTLQGVFESYDAGNTWQKLSTFNSGSMTYDVKNNAIYYYQNKQLYKGPAWQAPIQVSGLPAQASLFANNGILFATASNLNGSYSIYRSVNGKNWQQVYTSAIGTVLNAQIYSLGSNLYATSLLGTLQSTDDGQHWQTATFSGIPSSLSFTGLTTSDGGELLATTRGIYHLTNGQSQWADVGHWAFITKIITTPSQVYAVSLIGGIYKNVNGVWTPVNNAPFQNSIMGAVINDGETLYAGTLLGDIYKSTDQGQKWTEETLPPNLAGQQPFMIYHLGYVSSGAVVYALTDAGLYLEQQGNWLPISENGLADNSLPIDLVGQGSGTPTLYMTGLNMQNSPDSFTATMGQWLGESHAVSNPSSNSAFIYKSADLGASWTEQDAGLPVTESNFVPTKMLNVNGTLYLASNLGIFSSTNGATSWQKISNPITDPNNNLVISFTYQNGLFYLSTLKDFYTSSNAVDWTSQQANVGNLPVANVSYDTENKTLYVSTVAGIYTETMQNAIN